MGIYPLISGSIRVDGCDIRQFHTRDLHRLIGYLPQHHYLFYGTILQNLCLANPLLTEDKARDVLELVGLTKEIELMSEGIHTRIKDHASYSSPVSFQQRLALARALVKKPRILLLDEPTTGLDNDAERSMMETISNLKGELTIVMVTHRPSHLDLADRVLMLEKGQITALNAPK